MAAVKKFQRYLLHSDVLSVADTTDVSVFADASRANEVAPLPTSCLFKFVALHAVFNQQELWEAFIDEGIVSYSDRSIKEAGIPSLLRRFKRNGKKARSSNYRAIQLQQISADGGRTWQHAPAAPAVRDALLAQILVECVPNAAWDVFDAEPSRAAWKIANLTFLENLSRRAKGVGQYTHKCALDRVLAVRPAMAAMISWWPTECTGYMHAFSQIWPGAVL